MFVADNYGDWENIDFQTNRGCSHFSLHGYVSQTVSKLKACKGIRYIRFEASIDTHDGNCWNYWKYLTEIQIDGFIMSPVSRLMSRAVPHESCTINITSVSRICNANGRTSGVETRYSSTCRSINAAYAITAPDHTRENAPSSLSAYEATVLNSNRVLTWYLQPNPSYSNKPTDYQHLHKSNDNNNVFNEIYSHFNKTFGQTAATIQF